MAVMKYTPQFTERQYVPMNDIGLIGNMLERRQKEFDSAKMLENQAVSELYGLSTTQGFEPKRNELIQGLQGQIEEAVQKRGGDYGAAIQDIMGVVSKAQSDPFFQRNRRAMEQSKLLDQMTAKNPNLYVGNDTRKLGYREDLTDEDLNFNVLDPEDVRKLAKERLSHFDNKKLAGIYTSPSGYDVARFTRGPSEEDIQKLMQDDEFVNSMRGNFPQLAESNDPRLQALFKKEVEAAARSYVRDPEENVLQFNPMLRASLSGSGSSSSQGSGSGLPPTFMPLDPEVDSRLSRRMNKDIQDITSIMENGKVVEPVEKHKTRYTPTVKTRYGMEPETTSTSVGKSWDKFNRYKQDYQTLYNNIKEEGKGDSDFLAQVAYLEKSKGYVLENVARINNANFTANLPKALIIQEDLLYEYDQGKKKDKAIGLEGYNKLFDKTGLNPSDFSAFVTANGEILLQSPDGKKYAVSKKGLSGPVRQYTETMNKMYNSYYNYKLKPDDIDRINNELIPIGGGEYINLTINPDNMMQRVFNIVREDPRDRTKKIVVDRSDNFINIANYFTPLIERDIDATTFKPKVN